MRQFTIRATSSLAGIAIVLVFFVPMRAFAGDLLGSVRCSRGCIPGGKAKAYEAALVVESKEGIGTLVPGGPSLTATQPLASEPSIKRFSVRQSDPLTNVPQPFFDVGPVRIERMGILITQSGAFRASARCIHSGGRHGEVQSSRIRLTYTAYSGLANGEESLGAATILWQRSFDFRVYPETPLQKSMSSMLGQRFADITHFTVTAEYLRDR